MKDMAVLLSHLVNVRTLPRKGRLEQRNATAEEREAIASAHDLLEVGSFSADALIAPWKRDGVRVTGSIKASIVQACAVSFEPLTAVVEEKLDLIFVPEGSRLARPPTDESGEILLDPDGPDLPETFVGDSLDLGPIWLEFFSLGIDPHLRLPDISVSTVLGADQEDETVDSPFAALSSLKKH